MIVSPLLPQRELQWSSFNLQEPDSEEVIKKFVTGYNVKFDMFSKINVNGANAQPLYKYLKSQLKGTLGRCVEFNLLVAHFSKKCNCNFKNKIITIIHYEKASTFVYSVNTHGYEVFFLLSLVMVNMPIDVLADLNHTAA